MKTQQTWAKKYIKAKPRTMLRVVMCFGAETNSPRMIDGYVGVLNGDVVTHSGVLWETRKQAVVGRAYDMPLIQVQELTQEEIEGLEKYRGIL